MSSSQKVPPVLVKAFRLFHSLPLFTCAEGHRCADSADTLLVQGLDGSGVLLSTAQVTEGALGERAVAGADVSTAAAHHLYHVAAGTQGTAPRDGHHAAVAVHDRRHRHGHTRGCIGEHTMHR